ncbi:hypothetical protein HUB94_03410 [Paenibacillus cellulosilyticus]|nr:hypothetical protein HUB94_03410 [Paenibacillus cellulosilyticus]
MWTAGCSSDESASSSDSSSAVSITDAFTEQTNSQQSSSQPSHDQAVDTDAPDANDASKLELASSTYSLVGSIAGKYPIEMKLTLEGSRVSGTYMYTKYKQDLKLQGTVDEAASTGDKLTISMDEFDQDGKITGHFDGTLIFNTTNTPASLSAFVGSWTNADGTKTIPFEAVPASNPNLSSADAAWLGTWKLRDSTQFVDQTLKIEEITSASFSFNLDGIDGGHTGEVTESATRSKDGKTAVFTGNGLTLTFILQDSYLTITAEGDSTYYAGAGVAFGGQFVRDNTLHSLDLLQLNVLPSKDLDDQFRDLVGDDYSLFVNSFQIIDSYPDEDLPETTVVTGGVRGLFTEMEAIIMYDDNATFYAAVIADDGSVDYYTTDKSLYNKLPAAIEEWRSRFKEKDVVYMSFA